MSSSNCYFLTCIQVSNFVTVKHSPKPEARGCGQEELPHAPTPEARGGGQKDQPHIKGAMAARVQEGLEELSHAPFFQAA